MPTANTDDGGGGRSIGRRTFLRGVGATAAAGAGLASSDGPIGTAEAVVPTVLGGAAGAQIAQWLIGEFNPFSASSPDSGLTPSALKQDVYETARTRKSTNASTFVDNRNIIQMGLPNTLYVEGKLAAIEQLNNGATKADVETAALDAMAKYAATIEENLLKSWNESVNEVQNLYQSLQDHSDTGYDGVLNYWVPTFGHPKREIGFPSVDVTLSDGTTMTVQQLDDPSSTGDWHYDPTILVTDSSTSVHIRAQYDGNTTDYMVSREWNNIWTDLQNTISNVQSGLTTWVSNAYDEVQSGAIDVSELITPRERAQMLAEEDGAAQAIADLQALNIPVDVDNQVTLNFSSTGATLRGTLAMTNPEGQTLEPGTTYDPSASTWSGGDVYLTYDVSTGQGNWDAYSEGVDGGVATFGKEPYDNTTYRIDTSANETVSVNSGNFTPVDSNGNEVDPSQATAWEADLSSKLENDITNITEVSFFADVEKTKMETIQIDESFTLEEIRNTETDETKQSMTFESTDPQNDSNYITKEEWQQLEEQNEKLIEQYRKSQQSNGGLLGGLLPGGLAGSGVTAAAGGVLVVGLGIGSLKKLADFYLPGR